MLTVEEVAAQLRVSKMTVYRLCADGTIPSARIGRSYRIAEADFAAYLKQIHQPTPLRQCLAELADGWEGQYHVLRGDREENETCDDEINDAIAETYLENAERLRALLKEHE